MEEPITQRLEPARTDRAMTTTGEDVDVVAEAMRKEIEISSYQDTYTQTEDITLSHVGENPGVQLWNFPGPVTSANEFDDGLSKDERQDSRKCSKQQDAQRAVEGDPTRTAILDLARQHFHSEAGVIYVSDEYWGQLWYASGPCHLYVALNAIDTVKTRNNSVHIRNNSVHIRNNSVHTLKTGMKDTREAGATLASHLSSQGSPQSISTESPSRLKFVNTLLFEDMLRILGLENTAFNIVHVAPFRMIIPFEQKLRQRHLEVELLFAETAKMQPQHEAVLRQDPDWVPRELSHLVTYALIETGMERFDHDEVSIQRVLLDGYRALVHLLDHELSTLVDNYRKIRTRAVERLPFLHLWYLFEPGQEIVTNHFKPQVYRVLRVTGGRRLFRTRKEITEGIQRKTAISNLVIDCFHLDFDGKEFGPVPVTIAIKPYEGSRSIKQLAAYPLILGADSKLSETLVERGRKFGELTQASHRRYKGLSLRDGELFDTVEEVSPCHCCWVPCLNATASADFILD